LPTFFLKLSSVYIQSSLYIFVFTIAGKGNNFAILNHDEVNSLGEKYDFASIMHYALNLFSKRVTANVIVPKVNISTSLWANIGQRKHLSEGDVKQINKMYRCPSMFPTCIVLYCLYLLPVDACATVQYTFSIITSHVYF
jgi:hypothetical protein